MRIREVAPEIDPGTWLAGAQFADAYRIVLQGTSLDARTASHRMFARRSRWTGALLRLRNLIVEPFGLKTSGRGEADPRGMVGMFPVIENTPERLVAGFNDRHLDFRVVVDVAPADGGQQVTLTTLVLTHNLLGRIYLALVLPFHRAIVRGMLRRLPA